jgi:hypothetical protein
MTEPRILRFYLDPALRTSAQAGQHNFIARIADVVTLAGFDIEYRADTPAEILKAEFRPGYSLFHMAPPLAARSLTMRRVYHYPFWAIEHSAKRWEWRVAATDFPQSDVQRSEADRFFRFWQNRLFGDLPGSSDRQGFVYVPLQGRLLQHRSFQQCAPIEMIEHVLAQDQHRKVVAALHPKETYSAQEHQALKALVAKHPRLQVTTGDMEQHLTHCDYVVTQNSAAAFSGSFFGKNAILFAKSDFHHIAANISELGIQTAFDRVGTTAPDFAGYLFWFWQQMSINAGRSQAQDQIRDALRRGGWPV